MKCKIRERILIYKRKNTMSVTYSIKKAFEKLHPL